ncbi:MAG: choice-of-anchor X domain-containing protein [Polyangiales bacterium]
MLRAFALVIVLSIALLLLILGVFRAPKWDDSPGGGPSALTSASAVKSGATSYALTTDAAWMEAAVMGSRPQTMTAEQLAVWQQHMEEMRAALNEKTKYPPNSLPLAGKTDLIEPHHVETVHRPLQVDAEGGVGHVTITLSQSQLWLGDGEIASAFIAVTTDDHSKPPVSFARSEMFKSDGKTDGLGPSLGGITFRDDGVAPDLVAGDNIFSTFVPPRVDMLKGVTSAVLVDLDMLAGEERGTFRFHFVTTGPAPGKFTGVVTSAIEAGSLAFHVGIEVLQAGRFNIMARLYDAAGKPAALLTFVGSLTLDSLEVVLTAFGKTLLDQGLASPFALKDLEGFSYVTTNDSDRAVMAVLPGPYMSAAFDMNQLSSAEWDSPQRSKSIDAVNSIIASGPSEIAPVDSNGIPLPPMPLILPSGTPTPTPPPMPSTTGSTK